MASTARSSLSKETPAPSAASAYVAEFLGTLLLVFAITAAASANSTAGLGYTSFVVIGLVHAFALTVLIAAFGRFSGGHFNPAVTIGLLVIGKIKPSTAGVYIVVQLLGALAASGLLALAFTTDLRSVANLGAAGLTKELVTGRDGLAGGMIFEGIGVFILLLAVLGTAVAPGGDRRFAPLAIGTALGVGSLVAAPFTGGALNPARAFGPALVASEWGAGGVFFLVYILAPIVGAILAALVYNVLLGDEKHQETSPQEVYDEA